MAKQIFSQMKPKSYLFLVRVESFRGMYTFNCSNITNIIINISLEVSVPLKKKYMFSTILGIIVVFYFKAQESLFAGVNAAQYPQVVGEGWLCHATQPRGRLSEYYNFHPYNKGLCYTTDKNVTRNKFVMLVIINKKQVFKLQFF